MSREIYGQGDLEKFRAVQRLAYDTVSEVKNELFEGITEKEAAEKINQKVKEKGGTGFFHYGFAWFGDRTAFSGFKRPLDLFPALSELTPPHFGTDFLPSDRKLQPGMAVILDVAPIVDGFSADIGYAFSFGENPIVHQGVMDLEIFRSEILRLVLAEKTMSEIYTRVSSIISELGYVNCHSIYPAGVLAHKVGVIPFDWMPKTWVMGFQVQTFAYLLGQVAEEIISRFQSKSPIWNENTNSRPEPGLWAIEPHIGKDGVGVKFEEILVVTENNSYWLDDETPHFKYWKENKKEKVSIY